MLIAYLGKVRLSKGKLCPTGLEKGPTRARNKKKIPLHPTYFQLFLANLYCIKTNRKLMNTYYSSYLTKKISLRNLYNYIQKIP